MNNVRPKAEAKTKMTKENFKRRRPGVGREWSKQHAAPIDNSCQDIPNDIPSVSDEKQCASQPEDPYPPPRKIFLKVGVTPEKQWDNEFGGNLFDVYSELKKKQAEKDGFGFKED